MSTKHVYKENGNPNSSTIGRNITRQSIFGCSHRGSINRQWFYFYFNSAIPADIGTLNQQQFPMRLLQSIFNLNKSIVLYPSGNNEKRLMVFLKRFSHQKIIDFLFLFNLEQVMRSFSVDHGSVSAWSVAIMRARTPILD